MDDVKANEMQVGGDHYRSPLQHWDVVTKWNVPYLEGCASKYVSRWRKKNGKQDLLKARHFSVKLLEVIGSGQFYQRGRVPFPVLEQFVIANDLEMAERATLMYLWTWQSANDITRAIGHIDGMIREAEHAEKYGPGS